MTLPLSVLRYGCDKSLPDRIPLRAGPLALDFEEGGLRRVRLGDREIVRRAYVAVRDRHWGTVPAVLSKLRRVCGPDSFEIAFEAEHRRDGIHFVWQGLLRGSPDGTLTCTMDGEARSTFLRNRIGFCVLHPIRECAGAPCRVERVDGSTEESSFPRLISPHQPFRDIRAISHEVVPGLRAELRLEGETFEMEDQRNWSDASYKTYGTPLALPFPVEVKAGMRIAQSVTLTLLQEPSLTSGRDSRLRSFGASAGQRRPAPPRADPAPARPTEPDRSVVTVTVAGAPSGPLPRIGLGAAGHGRPLTAREAERLRALRLSHLRVDLRLTRPEWPDALRAAAADARAIGVPLEAALFLSDAPPAVLQAFLATLREVRPAVCRWLLFPATGTCTPPGLARLAREALTAYAPSAQFGGGTNHYFTELNRGRPPLDGLDLVCYSLNPQVHAFDNASLAEAIEGQAATLESARRLAGGLPVAVSPITLRPRFNPHRGWPEPDPPPGELPFSVDVRQMSLFGAAWTVGSLQATAEGGAASVTCYETAGWRGVMEKEMGSPVPEKFRSLPGAVFPLYHVLADVGEFAGGEVIPVATGDPLAVRGLAVRKAGRTRLLLANLGPEPRSVRVRGLGERTRVRMLDETNGEAAMREPEAYRAGAGEPAEVSGGAPAIRLLPCSVARVDAPLE